MGKRDGIYDGVDYQSPYPTPAEQVHKACEICGIDMVVNNWDDKKSRTPKFLGFVVCVDCDPRAVDEHYLKEGYKIMFPRRLRVIRLAQVTRALARHGCLKPMEGVTCKCAGCAAGRLFPVP